MKYEMPRWAVDLHHKPTTIDFGYKTVHFKSKAEARWAKHLELLCQLGQIKRWDYEPETFWFPVKRGIRSYKPDFVAEYIDKGDIFYEVKVALRQKDITKFHRMAIHYKTIRLVVVMDHCPKGHSSSARRQLLLLRDAQKYVCKVLYMNKVIK